MKKLSALLCVSFIRRLLILIIFFGFTQASYAAFIIPTSFSMDVTTPANFEISSTVVIESDPYGQWYASTGKFLSTIFFDGTASTSESLIPPLGLHYSCSDIIYDSIGNLYLADPWENSIFKRGPSETSFITFTSEIPCPRDLAIDSLGNLIVSGGNCTITQQGSIWKVTPSGIVSLLVDNLLAPTDLEIDNAGNVYVATFGGDIYTVSDSGDLSLYYSIPDDVVGSGIGYVQAFAIDNNDNIFVSINEGDRFAHHVNSSEIYRIDPLLNLDLFAVGIRSIAVDMIFTDSNELLIANFNPYTGSNVIKVYGDFSASAFEIAEPSLDTDGDGIPYNEDLCLNSDLSETVTIDGCDSGVQNMLLDDGCTISDLISQCADDADNHGEFVSCVSHLTNDLKKDGIISGKEKGKIQSCTAKADIP